MGKPGLAVVATVVVFVAMVVTMEVVVRSVVWVATSGVAAQMEVG